MIEKIKQTSELIKKSKHTVAFTGAGISVESGIPPFRGKNGLWNKYNPEVLDLDYFYKKPLESWSVIKEIFYEFFGTAKPNPAHFALAELEEKGFLKTIITQNIDNLHQEAGNKTVYEFHGNSKRLICTKCSEISQFQESILTKLPPECSKCGGILKPDFIFFGEGIPEFAFENSFIQAKKSEILIIIGTTGEVYPASLIPVETKENGGKIIEINLQPSNYTNKITDIFLQGKAGEILPEILKNILDEK